MYVRWKRRPLTHTYDWGNLANTGRIERHALDAVLVESRRVDGKPRQFLVCHLGHIESRWAGRPADRFAFWWSARRALDALGLLAAERRRIEAKLVETVEPVGPEPFHDPEEWERLMYQSDEAALAVLQELDLPAHDHDGRAAKLWDREVARSLRRKQADHYLRRELLLGRSSGNDR